jgi:hypothetical protein
MRFRQWTALLVGTVMLGLLAGSGPGGAAPARSSAGVASTSHHPVANLWVDTKSGGTCSRSPRRIGFDPKRACASPAAAWAAARNVAAGSLILFRGGVYHGWSVTTPRTRAAKGYVVFAPARGQRVLIRGEITFGCWTCLSADSPSWVTLRGLTTDVQQPGDMDPGVSRYGVYFLGGHNLRLEHVVAGSFFFGSGGTKLDMANIAVIGGSYGPCRRSQTYSGCEINKVFHARNVRIFGVDIHDYLILPSCLQACHWRSMFLVGLDGFTMRNSTVRHSVFDPWFSITDGTGSKNILIENNYFGASALYGSGFALAWCVNAVGSVSYANVTIRFNSFARNTALAIPGTAYTAELGCKVRNIKVYGNIIGAKSAGYDGGNPCGAAGVTWSYNVFVNRANRGTCGRGDVSVVSGRMPFYKHDTLNPMNRGDYVLVGRRRAADNRVPVSAGCPARDRRGVRRPQDKGFCDAGANER